MSPSRGKLLIWGVGCYTDLRGKELAGRFGEGVGKIELNCIWELSTKVPKQIRGKKTREWRKTFSLRSRSEVIVKGMRFMNYISFSFLKT